MKVNVMKKIETGVQLKKARLKLSLPQSAFSIRLGISIRQLSRIETGESDITETISLLATYIYKELIEAQ